MMRISIKEKPILPRSGPCQALSCVTNEPISFQVSGAGDPVRVQEVYDCRRQDVFFVWPSFCAESGKQIIQGSVDSHGLWRLCYCTCTSLYRSFHNVAHRFPRKFSRTNWQHDFFKVCITLHDVDIIRRISSDTTAYHLGTPQHREPSPYFGNIYARRTGRLVMSIEFGKTFLRTTYPRGVLSCPSTYGLSP